MPKCPILLRTSQWHQSMPQTQGCYSCSHADTVLFGFNTGHRYQNIIFGGHSYGGSKAETEATKNGGGLITIGTGLSTLKPGSTIRSIAQYPLPVLSAVGELDGQLRWTTLATGIVEMLNTGVQMGLK